MCDGESGDEINNVSAFHSITAVKSLSSSKGLYNGNGKVEVIYVVGHSDKNSTVDQDLILTNDGSGWVAQMPMLEFPEQSTATKAAHKLADWMERLSKAIKVTDFESINMNKL